MNTANLENSKKLHELSGWELLDDDPYREFSGHWIERLGHPPKSRFAVVNHHSSVGYSVLCPAYPLGYLLRKLQPLVGEKYGRLYLEFAKEQHQSKNWYCSFVNEDRGFPVGEADTPEDCCVLLAIKLFEEGILTAPTNDTESMGGE